MTHHLSMDELERRVAAQQPVVEEHVVYAQDPAILQKLEARKSISLVELLRGRGEPTGTRIVRYGHLLGPALSRDDVETWVQQHAPLGLPADLISMLTRFDGVHLWADLDRGRAYEGILSLREWVDVAHAAGSPVYFEHPPEDALLISYHDNGDAYVLLDTREGVYRAYDTQNIDHPALIGHSVPELLGWLWERSARRAR